MGNTQGSTDNLNEGDKHKPKIMGSSPMLDKLAQQQGQQPPGGGGGGDDAKKRDSATGALPTRPMRRTGQNINLQDIEKVRSKLKEFTSNMNVWQRFELVVGTDAGPAKAPKDEDDAKLDEDKSDAPAQPAPQQPAPAPAPQQPAKPEPEPQSQADDEDGTAPHDSTGKRGSMIDRRRSRRGGVIKFEDEKELKRKAKRDNVIQEIQASERLYFHFLQILIDKFIKPLREQAIITEDQMREVFANIELIAPYHQRIADELEQVDDDVPSVFQQYASYLKIYTPYINNYDRACDVVASLKKNTKFTEFLAERRKDAECGGLDLMSFLIMPIQRIPRYKLLLEELKRNSKETDEELVALDDAIEKISRIANHVNEARRQAESRSKIIEIQHRIQGDFDNLLQPSRMLLKEGPISVLKKKTLKPSHLFLFNDIILWTTAAKQYSFQGVTNLDCVAWEEQTFVNGDTTLHGFMLKYGKEELVLMCRSRGERNTWLELIGQARKDLQAPMTEKAAAKAVTGPRLSEAGLKDKRQSLILDHLKDLKLDQLSDASLQPRQQNAE